MKYRKKIASIEAFQYDGDLMNSNGEYYVPQWAVDELRYKDGMLYYDGPDLMFKTPFEDMNDIKVNIGDYIVKEENAIIFPCNEKRFKRTYERVE